MTALIPSPGVLVLALVIDLLLGEPRNRYHPVAWMGTLLATVQRWAPRKGRWRPLLYGAAVTIGGITLAVGIGMIWERVASILPWWLRWLLEAYLLKLTLSVRGLAQAARQVQKALETDQLAQARQLLGWHLVSRDTTQLSASHVAAAAIESVAENTSDGAVAPLFYYALGGLPAALAYRFINTADAMLGYRHPELLWLGKIPARVDDAVNLLPARLTALLMLLAVACQGGPVRRAWTVWRRDARQTLSPNAGHPMSVAAGALGVELEKIGHYRLAAGQPSPKPSAIAQAIHLMVATMILVIVVLLSLVLVS